MMEMTMATTKRGRMKRSREMPADLMATSSIGLAEVAQGHDGGEQDGQGQGQGDEGGGDVQMSMRRR